MAQHFQRAVGDVLDFHDENGQIYSVTLVSRQSIPGGLNPDITVGLLDVEVPLPYYKVLPPRDDWFEYLDGALLLSTHHPRNVSVRDIRSLSGLRISFGPTDLVDSSFYTPAVSGTSGHPLFVLVNDELVLVSSHTFGGFGSGPFFSNPSNFDEINRIMGELGGGYQLETINIDE